MGRNKIIFIHKQCDNWCRKSNQIYLKLLELISKFIKVTGNKINTKINFRMVKEMVVDPTMEYHLARKSKKWLIYTKIWMKLKEIMMREKSQLQNFKRIHCSVSFIQHSLNNVIKGVESRLAVGKRERACCREHSQETKRLQC